MSEYLRRPLGWLKGGQRRLGAGGIAAALLLGGPLLAHDYALGSLTIAHPWARETAAGQDAGGAFLTIVNKGKQADRLVSGSTTVAREVQIHTMTVQDGVMRMRQLKNGLDIPAGKSVGLKPGGYHIMLMGLKQPLKRGTRVPVTLDFQKAGKLRVELVVEPITSTGPAGGHDHG